MNMSENHPGRTQQGMANPEGDDMNLFASVWVKVELEEGVSEEPAIKTELEDPIEEVQPCEQQRKKPRKTRPQKRISLKCPECDYQCGVKQALNAHILTHSPTKPYACSHCDYKTKYPLSLKRHEFVQHECKLSDTARENLPTYKCSKCEYTTNFKWNLRAHFRKHDLPKKYQCPYCSFSTAYKHNHDKHSRIHSKERLPLYSCDKCPFTTKFEGHIVRHLAKIHLEVSDKASRCDQCSFSSRIKWRLNLHMNRSREEKTMYCPICNFETNYRCAYKEHKKTHTEKHEMSHRWLETLLRKEPEAEQNGQDAPKNDGNSLNQSYDNSESYSVEPSHSNEDENTELDKEFDELKDKYANDAYYTYNPNPNLQTFDVSYVPLPEDDQVNHYRLDPTCEVEWKNIQVLETPHDDRPFQCIICTYKAKFKASVQRHYQRLHTSHNRPYICVKCEFSTKTKDQISLHVKRSKSQALLTCKICNYSTFFKCQYAVHEKAHLPFRCLYCDYACKKKYEIQTHFGMVHLGKGLKCSYCEFKTPRRETLLIHESTHTGNKPYHCELCPYSATRRQLLINHLVRVHRKEGEETVLDESKIPLLRKSSAIDNS